MPETTRPGALPILYSFRRCPYAMRARLAIKASGVQVALREVVLRDKPAALIEASAKATVPVLQLRDGTVIDQSLDIMRWALAQHDSMGWLRAEERDEVQALVDLNDGPFKTLLDRYKYSPRHPERSPESWRDEAALLLLKPLNDRLTRHGYLLRDTPSIADIAIAPFIRQFAAVDPGWFENAPLPELRQWLNALIGSPLFMSVMARYPAWQAGDPDVVL